MPGYIKIYRKITEWEWYPDINTTRVFIHLLLTANHKDKKYKGRIVPRGSLATTIPKLSEETALTVKEVRTALNHLKSTSELGIQTTNRESIIKVHNYNVYQGSDDDDGQTKGRQRADERQSKGVRTEEECKECNKEKEKGTNVPSKKKFVPPTLEEVVVYCRERNSPVDAAKFYEYFDTGGWIDGKGNPVRNWKQKIITWEGSHNGSNRVSTGRKDTAAPAKDDRPKYGLMPD